MDLWTRGIYGYHTSLKRLAGAAFSAQVSVPMPPKRVTTRGTVTNINFETVEETDQPVPEPEVSEDPLPAAGDSPAARAARQEAADAAYARRCAAQERRAPCTAQGASTGPTSSPPPSSRASSSATSTAAPSVAEAAADLGRQTGGPARASRPQPVAGPLPPTSSSTGRKYYAFFISTPCVACGQAVALRLNGGSWLGAGRAPSGYATLEDALNALIAHYPSKDDFPVCWK